jgi:predicted TIM-barrel fold metal-dependent hydrolase
MFGTDFPHRKTAEQAAALSAMDLGASALDAIFRDNARQLVPRLAGA